MARLFEGAAGTAAYNAAAGKFDEVDSTKDPVSGQWYVPFDYGTEAEFKKKVDLSLAGNMMDCGECHVGGGMMQFIPYKDELTVTANDMDFRIPLRNIASADVNGFGPITAANYTAFNYFIDNYDVDNDGDETEVLYMDYTKTGVMEMDCLMCHLPGYKYEARRATLRDAKIDATRAIGAGFATDNGLTWADGAAAPVGYGTTVIYDNSMFEITAGNTLRLSAEWMNENIATKPDSTNCANCHMNEFSVDWKKRGDHWAPEGQYDFQYEVHYNLGCMGCHERKPTAAQPDPEAFTSVYGGPYPLQGPGSLGHDPAKGASPYSGLYNKNDNAAFKSCENCHLEAGDGGADYAAPIPNAAHAAAGLTAKIVQSPSSTAGVASISHIDLMHCSACHTRNAESYDWNGTADGNGNTGAPLIDATGGDHDKRLTDHENDYVIRQDMTDNTSLAWYKGKLLRVNPSATMFWRDKNDTPALDANFDGRPHGMDALLMTDVLAVNKANTWGSITEDNHGMVSPKDFGDRIAAFNTYIEGKAGVAAGTAKTKFSIFHVNFQEQHGVAPASMSWGVNGCVDCHDANAEFYNGTVDTTGTNNVMFYGTSTSQRVPFTKVNGFSQATDWHPGQMDKLGKRTIAVQISNTATTCDDDEDGGAVTPDVACMTTRSVERSENMYEATFKGPADFADSYVGTAIDFSTFEKGWLLMVEVQEVATGTVSLYTKAIPGDVTDMAGLLAGLGGNFTGPTFNFTVVDNGSGGITVASVDPALYKIRLKGGVSNAASFGLEHAAYKLTPWTGVDGSVANGRADWVNYLNGITAAGTGIGVDPVAAIASIGSGDIIVGTPVNMVANTTQGAGTFSYSWFCNDTADEVLDGSTVSKTFNQVGTWVVTLNVVDEEGKLAQVSQSVKVVAAAPAADIVSTDLGVGVSQDVTFSNLAAPHTMLYVIWGDGTASTRLMGSGDPMATTHTFAALPKYDKGTYYEYNVVVRVYNGRSVKEVKSQAIRITK